MLTYSVIVLALTAVGGVILAIKVLGGKLASWPVSIAHAILGAAGLVLLLIPVLKGAASGRAGISLVLLAVAAVGGFFLASFHARKQVAPRTIVIVHAAVAVAGFLVLLSVLLGL